MTITISADLINPTHCIKCKQPTIAGDDSVELTIAIPKNMRVGFDQFENEPMSVRGRMCKKCWDEQEKLNEQLRPQLDALHERRKARGWYEENGIERPDA